MVKRVTGRRGGYEGCEFRLSKALFVVGIKGRGTLISQNRKGIKDRLCDLLPEVSKTCDY